MVHRPAENHHQPRKYINSKITKKQLLFLEKANKEIFQELHTYGDVYLLNKPNMTSRDKANMEKSIKFLADHKMNTLENLQKLDAIIYTKDYIEIGGVKRARKNLQGEANGKDIFKHKDEVYFTFDALKKQNKLLDKQGMKIPGIADFVDALQALPGDYLVNPHLLDNSSDEAYILGNILDLPKSGSCSSDGTLHDNSGEYGYGWSSSEKNGDAAWAWCFVSRVAEGKLSWHRKSRAYPVRPIYK